MSISVWIAIGLVFIIVWGFIVWEIYTAPVMPDDYGIEDEELWKELNGSKKKKEQNKTGFYNGKDDEWYPDQDIN